MESDRVSLQGSSRRMTSGRRSALLVVDREHLHNTSAFVGFDAAARHEALSREDWQAVVTELDLPRDVLPAPSRLSREAEPQASDVFARSVLAPRTQPRGMTLPSLKRGPAAWGP